MIPILQQSLWRDEAFSALLSEKSPLEIIRLTIQDASPPFYYILLHYWIQLFGNSEVALRSLSLLFHILTAFTIFLIARKIIRSHMGQILIAATTLLNPFLLQYAFEARAYSILAFLSVLAVYFALEKRNLLTGIVLALAILSHNFGIFTFLAFAAWLLVVNRRHVQLTEALGFISMPFVTLLLWGGSVWMQWTNVAQGFWIDKPTPESFQDSLEIFFTGDLSYTSQRFLYTATTVLCLFALSYWITKRKKKDHPIVFLIFLIILFPSLIAYLISIYSSSIYLERYLIATVPMIILLIGYSLDRIYVMYPGLRAMPMLFIALYVLPLVFAGYQIITTPTKPPIREGVSEILSKATSEDIIVPLSILNFLETKYYIQRSGKDIPFFAYSPDGNIPFYVGAVLYGKDEIIMEMPKGKRVWQIDQEGRTKLKVES